eukprot:3434282-Amphidinium_carterae.1
MQSSAFVYASKAFYGTAIGRHSTLSHCEMIFELSRPERLSCVLRFCLGVEHGDYNGTELFGVGTDRFIWLAYKPNSSGQVHGFGLGEVLPRPDTASCPQQKRSSRCMAISCYLADAVMPSMLRERRVVSWTFRSGV